MPWSALADTGGEDSTLLAMIQPTPSVGVAKDDVDDDDEPIPYKGGYDDGDEESLDDELLLYCSIDDDDDDNEGDTRKPHDLLNSKYMAMMEERRKSLSKHDFHPALPEFAPHVMVSSAIAASAPVLIKPEGIRSPLSVTNNIAMDSSNFQEHSDNVYAYSKHFPVKLHRMVEQGSTCRGDVVHWSDDGRAFWLNSNDNEDVIATLGYCNMSSFRRQLNTYGWKKMKAGKHNGYWVHPKFCRKSTLPQLLAMTARGGRNHGFRSAKHKNNAARKKSSYKIATNPKDRHEEKIKASGPTKHTAFTVAAAVPILAEPDGLDIDSMVGVKQQWSATPSTGNAWGGEIIVGAALLESPLLQPLFFSPEGTVHFSHQPAPVAASMFAPPNGLDALAEAAASRLDFSAKSLDGSFASTTEHALFHSPCSLIASPIKRTFSYRSFSQDQLLLTTPAPTLSNTGMCTPPIFSPLEALYTPIQNCRVQDDATVEPCLMQSEQENNISSTTISPEEELKASCSCIVEL